MHPLVRGAAAAAMLTALGRLDRSSAADPGVPSPSAPAKMSALCGPREVPDGEVCVPLPPPGAPLGAASAMVPKAGMHRTEQRGWEVYEQLPRRPDRPADHGLYAYPLAGPARVLSDYDLDRPADQQRRGPGFHVTGHGGLDLAGRRGDLVALVPLLLQEGDAEVLYVGDLFGTTVVTTHAVREAGRLRQYVVLYGHLQSAATSPGARLAAGAKIGEVGDSGSPGIVHLHLEVRQLREGISAGDLRDAPRRITDKAATLVSDPRNVFPLRTELTP